MPIKLLKIDEMEDGTTRFQSQLFVGRAVADFIQRPNGVMECWGGRGEWVEYKGEYEIVTSIEEMKYQKL
jgi:hypothetical protein